MMTTTEMRTMRRTRTTGYEGLRDRLVALHPKQRCYIEERWYFQLAAAQQSARRARDWVYVSRFVSAAGVALLPPVLALEAYSGRDNAPLCALAAALSIVVAVSGGILSIARVQQRWRLYHSLRENLGRLGWELASPGGVNFCQFRLAVERCLCMAEIVYQSSVAVVAAPEAGPHATGENGATGAEERSMAPLAA
jgi:hypothetical protein